MPALDQDAAHDRCLALPASVLEQPFGPETSVMKVVGRVFAIITRGETPAAITLKCEPPRVLDLVAEHGEIIPGYHMNKRHWITVTLSPVLSAELGGGADRGLVRPGRRRPPTPPPPRRLDRRAPPRRPAPPAFRTTLPLAPSLAPLDPVLGVRDSETGSPRR